MNKSLNMDTYDDFNLFLLPYIAEIISGYMPENIRQLRYDAICQLRGQLASYRREGFAEKLLCNIAIEKGCWILRISSKTEMKKLLNPGPPRFDGNRFYPGEYLTCGEEAIAWSKASMNAPLKSVAQERYMEVFKLALPEEYERLFQQDDCKNRNGSEIAKLNKGGAHECE